MSVAWSTIYDLLARAATARTISAIDSPTSRKAVSARLSVEMSPTPQSRQGSSLVEPRSAADPEGLFMRASTIGPVLEGVERCPAGHAVADQNLDRGIGP